jgi:hypothetical protein
VIEQWGFELVKHSKIRRYLTMTKQGNFAKPLNQIAKDAGDRQDLYDAVKLLGRCYYPTTKALTLPDSFPAWNLWTSAHINAVAGKRKNPPNSEEEGESEGGESGDEARLEDEPLEDEPLEDEPLEDVLSDTPSGISSGTPSGTTPSEVPTGTPSDKPSDVSSEDEPSEDEPLVPKRKVHPTMYIELPSSKRMRVSHGASTSTTVPSTSAARPLPPFKKKQNIIWSDGGGDPKEREDVDSICQHRLSPRKFMVL